MNILFYAEPLPIRNSFHQHSGVAHKFSKMIVDNADYLMESGIKVQVLANNHVHNELLMSAPELRPFLHVFDPNVSSAIEGMLVDWRAKGIEMWKDLMSGRGDSSIFTDEILTQVKKTCFDFDVLVCWGQNGALTNFCRKNNILLLHMELGSIRNPFPEYVILDPCGVNGNASPLNLTIEDIKSVSDPIDPHFARLLLSVDDQNQSEKRTAFDACKRVFKNRDILQAEKIALLPLQLLDDANILLYSPFKTPLDFLEKTIPTLVEGGYHVVVKAHPAAKTRPVNYLHQKECIEYSSNLNNVTVLDEDVTAIENLELVNLVDLVVTINSSLGFESLLFDKVVCVLGDAMYKVRDIFPSLEDVISGCFDVSLYKKNIRYLVAFILENYFLSPSFVASSKFFRRIEYLKNESAKSLSVADFENIANLGLNNDFTEEVLENV